MKVSLGSFLEEITEKTTKNDQYPVLTSSKSGLFLQSDYFNKQVASKDNTGYKIIRKGQFTYRAMSDTGEFFPNMLECAEIGIVSPAYPVFGISRENVVEPEYLKYFFQSDEFQHSISSFAQGSTRTSVKFEKMKTVLINLPSLEEQKKTILKLDKVADLISLRKQQLAKLDEAVKSQFIELFGSISETVPLSYYIASLSAGKSLAGEEECPNKVLKTGAVSYDYFDPEQVKNLPVDYKPQEDHRVKDGDVIISRMNTAELVGAAAYVWNAPEHTYLPDRLWKAAIKDTACPIFVWQALIQNSTKESIRRIASGTSGSMKNISKSELLGIRVRKVPLTQQEQFAVLVRQSDKSKFAIRQSLDKLELLKKSLMQQYFG